MPDQRLQLPELQEATVRGKNPFRVSFLISEGRVFFSPDTAGTSLFSNVDHLTTDAAAFQAVNRAIDTIVRKSGMERRNVDWYLVVQLKTVGADSFGFYRLVLDASLQKANVYTAIRQELASFDLIAVRFFRT